MCTVSFVALAVDHWHFPSIAVAFDPQSSTSIYLHYARVAQNWCYAWMMHECTCQKPAHELKACNYSGLFRLSWIIYAGFAKGFSNGLHLYVYRWPVTFYTCMLFEMREAQLVTPTVSSWSLPLSDARKSTTSQTTF